MNTDLRRAILAVWAAGALLAALVVGMTLRHWADDRRGDIWAAASTLLLLVIMAALLHWHLHRQFMARLQIEAARARLAASHEELLAQVRARERSDADLDRTQALMNSLLANTHEGFWLIDTEGRTVDVNPAMCTMLGRSREQVLQRTIYDFVDAHNAAVFRRQIELRRNGHGATYELSLLRPDGSTLTCINNAAPVTDAKGRRIGSVGLWTDVSPMIAAQRDLSRAQSTIDGALAAMAEGILLFDPDDRLVRWNRHYELLFPHLAPLLRVGMPLSELHAASAKHLLPDGSAAEHAAWIAARACHHRLGGAPLEIVQPDGRVIEIAEAAMPSDGFVATYRDVSAARRAERELREAKTTLDQALDAMSDGFVVFDADERLLVWNRRYLQMFPYLDGRLQAGMAMEAIGDIAARALMPDATAAERRAFMARRREERLRGTGVTSMTLANGCVVEAIDRRTDDGKLVSLFRDVTHTHQAARALEEARDAAEQAAQAKTQFLAVMSHEIRTPLNAVLGMNGLLRDSTLDPQQRRWVDLIAKSGESLLAVINDILDLARLEAGKLSLEVVDFSPLAAVHDVVSIMSARAQAKGLVLELQADTHDEAQALRVRSDPSRLRQLLFNLVDNAIKFTERGHVAVALTSSDVGAARAALAISVRDTGVGIAPEVLPHLFKPFSQADRSISRRFGGSGLGLSICREIVHLMGGRIDVQSTPGQGSVFRVELTLDALAPAPAMPRTHVGPTLPTVPSLRGLRVLVAEDNSVNQLLIRALLDRMGHYHDVVADGVEVLRQVQAAPYDLVLMDVQMPQMDGLAATRAIRALTGPAAQVPIIAMTANVLQEDRAACEAAGMSAFVGKPIDRQRLGDAIERVLDTAAATSD
jgi:PAS domain S-box-containing protein